MVPTAARCHGYQQKLGAVPGSCRRGRNFTRFLRVFEPRSQWKHHSGSKRADPRTRYEPAWGCVAQLTLVGLFNAFPPPNPDSSWTPWWLKTESRPGRVQRPRLTATRARSSRPLAKVTSGELAERAKLSAALIQTGSPAPDTSLG